MFHRRQPGICLAICLVTLAFPAGSAEIAGAAKPDPGATASAQALQRWLAGTKDLQGEFVQEMVSGALGSALSESGSFRMERPGRIRWDYAEPEYKVAIVDHGLTLLYVAEDEQMILGTLDEAAGLLPRLLAGDEPIETMFEVVPAGRTELQEIDVQRQARVVLRPLASEDSVSRILLTLSLPDHAIQAADVLDSAGNRQQFRFTGLRRNAGLEGTPFDFEPPAGTEILGGS